MIEPAPENFTIPKPTLETESNGNLISRFKSGRKLLAGMTGVALLASACSSPAEGQPTPAPTAVETATDIEEPAPSATETPEVTETAEHEPGTYVNPFVQELYESGNYPTPGTNDYMLNNVDLWVNPEYDRETIRSSTQRVGLDVNGDEVYYNSTPEKTAQDLHVEAIQESLVIDNADVLDLPGHINEERSKAVVAHGEKIVDAFNEHLFKLPYFSNNWEREAFDELWDKGLPSPIDQNIYFDDLSIAMSGGELDSRSEESLNYLRDLAVYNDARAEHLGLDSKDSPNLIIKTDSRGEKLIASVGSEGVHGVSVVIGVEANDEYGDYDNIAVPLTIAYEVAEIDGKDVLQITEVTETAHPQHWGYIQERGEGWFRSPWEVE